MGHKLMDKVVTYWGDLAGNTYKALMVIAYSARDDDERPVYWGGWERLAIVGMGRRHWPPDDDVSEAAVKLRKSHWEAVRKALEDARSAGAISVKTRGRPGSRAEFWVHLDRSDTGKPCIGIQEDPAVAQENPAVAQENPAPNYQQKQQRPGRETTSSTAVPHQGRESPVDNHLRKSNSSRLSSARQEELRRRIDAEDAT